MDAGVSSFKIEGRLKDVAYVKNITAYYRKKIDEILAKRDEFKRPSFGNSIYFFDPVPEKSFNRGFTTYFLNGRNKDITAFDSPKSLGEVIGKVKDIKGKTIVVAGHKQLNNGDGLAFFNKQDELEGFRVNRVEANKIQPFEMPRIDANTLLYRNYDAKFEQQMAKPSAERKLTVDIVFGDNPFGFTLCMEDESGARIMITQPFKKEKARVNQQANIRTQLSKLGNTPFEAKNINIKLREDWFVPSSVLTDMRQQASEKLILLHKIRYRQEIAKFKQTGNFPPFIQKELTYLGNIANEKAKSFYHTHEVNEIAKAFELEQQKNVSLMFTKHCLRYSMGWCPLHGGSKSPFKEPYFLTYKDKRLRLSFDCKNCEMHVSIDE
jgi:putative protease